MYCTHCGAKNSDTAKFCRSCGMSLEEEVRSVEPNGGAASPEGAVQETGGEKADTAETQQLYNGQSYENGGYEHSQPYESRPVYGNQQPYETGQPYGGQPSYDTGQLYGSQQPYGTGQPYGGQSSYDTGRLYGSQQPYGTGQPYGGQPSYDTGRLYGSQQPYGTGQPSYGMGQPGYTREAYGYQSYGEEGRKKQKKKGKKGIIVAVILVLLAALVGGGTFLYIRESSPIAPVKSFFKGFASLNPGKIYDSIYWGEENSSGWMSREEFIREVKDDLEIGSGLMQLASLDHMEFNITHEGEAYENGDGLLRKEITVEVRVEFMGESISEELGDIVVVKSGKKFLFIPVWKLDHEEMDGFFEDF